MRVAVRLLGRVHDHRPSVVSRLTSSGPEPTALIALMLLGGYSHQSAAEALSVVSRAVEAGERRYVHFYPYQSTGWHSASLHPYRPRWWIIRLR